MFKACRYFFPKFILKPYVSTKLELGTKIHMILLLNQLSVTSYPQYTYLAADNCFKRNLV